LELGHGSALAGLYTTGDRILSEDGTGHWNLWDYASGKIITSGDGALTTTVTSPFTDQPSAQGEIALAGQVAVVQTSTGINVLSASDGSALSTIPAAAWWMLATDGSYLCTGSTTGLTVYSTSGQTVLTHSGDYHAAVAFAAPGQVQIALGAAGANVIETVTVPSGSSTVSPTFNGTFFSWFLDGGHFLTKVANTYLAYSNAGVQQGTISVSNTTTSIIGTGNWIVVDHFDLDIYPIGGSSSAYSLAGSVSAEVSGTVLLAQVEPPPFTSTSLTLLDLSGATPNVVHTYPNRAAGVFAASSIAQWVFDRSGAIMDGPSLSATERSFGYGMIDSIVATPNLVALAASNGQTLLMDPSAHTVKSTIKFQAGQLALSSDGSVLGVGGGDPATNGTVSTFIRFPC